jgi:hypothetical protein
MTTHFNIDTPNTHKHHRSLSWIATGTSIKNGGVFKVQIDISVYFYFGF